MKPFHFLLAAGLFCFSAASAQTTTGTTTPSTPGPKGTASSSAPVSGMAAPVANPKGAVGSGEVFTTGEPNSNRMRAKRTKTKGTMDGSGKMKTKM